MKEIQSFYSNLYDKNPSALAEDHMNIFLSGVDNKKLSFEQKEILDKNLTRSKLFEALRSFKNNKTPGNDGLTAEFYLAFWPLLEKQLVESLQFSHVHGQLSTSQKQALIILLEKKDKDRRFIKNWRPISLINVDVKIVSKAMAKRLEPFLLEIIHYNQNGFVKGRSVFDAVRTIDDILEFAEVANRSGILVAIDFEKAFDSLNHNFLFKALEKFNFGPYFMQWVKTFYTDISSCVINNGFTTNLFCIQRGVRQGDPLSPLLFILALETLLCQIRQDHNIKGIKISGEEIKLTAFADDITCFLQDKLSYLHLFTCLETFSRYFGLKVNNDKTEVFAIGRQHLKQAKFTHTVRSTIKILGVFFDYHIQSRMKANFDSIFKSVQNTLNMWKCRGLTLLGKIQVVKTFVIPKFVSKAAIISISKDLIKEINRLIYGFIWRGNDKIKRSAIINDIENGGLKMLDLESMIKAQRVIALKKYLDISENSWKVILDEFLQGVGGKLVLSCNFDSRKLPIYIPAFYTECFDAWSELTSTSVNSYEDVINQVIWNNKNIIVQKESVFDEYLFTLGIIKIGDLLSDTGIFFQSSTILQANLSPIQRFKLMSIADAIPQNWRLIIKQSEQHYHPQLFNDTVFVKMDGKDVDILKTTSKLLYKKFKSKKQTPPTAQKKAEK